MSNEIPVWNVIDYKSTVAALLQQRGSKLRDLVTTDNYHGDSGVPVSQLGPVTAKKKTSRHSDTPIIETPHDRRWVFPEDYEWADLIDKQDQLRIIADPTSPYAINGAMSLGRSMDDEIIDAFFGDAKTGEKGTVVETFDTANQQIAAGGAGMSVSKLIEAKEILMANEVDIDTDMLFCAITAKQHTNLLNETKTTSLDYNTRPVLVDGRITSFMGFNFVHIERLEKDGANRRCPVWAKSGMHLGMWNDIDAKITERADKSYSTQVYTSMTVGSTRLENGKVVDVQCQE